MSPVKLESDMLSDILSQDSDRTKKKMMLRKKNL